MGACVPACFVLDTTIALSRTTLPVLVCRLHDIDLTRAAAQEDGRVLGVWDLLGALLATTRSIKELKLVRPVFGDKLQAFVNAVKNCLSVTTLR